PGPRRGLWAPALPPSGSRGAREPASAAPGRDPLQLPGAARRRPRRGRLAEPGRRAGGPQPRSAPAPAPPPGDQRRGDRRPAPGGLGLRRGLPPPRHHRKAGRAIPRLSAGADRDLRRCRVHSLRFPRYGLRPGRAGRPPGRAERRRDGRIDMSAKKNLVEDIYPLSPAQAGMLFHALHAPESGTYVLQVSGRLEGDLDEDAFERAWQAVLDRHTILRTAFVADKRDEPFQVVYRTLKLACERLDARDLDADQREEELRNLLERERACGFDPARPPLLRIILIRVAERAWRFVWTHHHLILDGWSRPAILREVFAAYEALRAGQPVDARPVRPFRDYVQWLQKQDRAAAEAYWRHALQGFRAPIRLGREPEVGAAVDTPDLGESRLDLTAAETAALQDFARRHDLTVYTLLQAAWGLLLSRAGGAADVVFGAVTSGRPADLPGAERMVGMFINTLPVRLRIDGGAALLPWLRELQAAQVEQRQHEHAPLAQVQAWSEAPRGVPLFESLLDFVNYPVADSLRQEGGSLRISDVRHWEKTNFPLVLVAMPGPLLRLSLAWDPRRFDARDAERLLGRLAAVLRRLLEDPDRLVEDLAPLDPIERHLLLHEWNDTAVELPSEPTLHGLFLARAERTPDAVALVCAGEQLTYGELARRAHALASHLRDL